MDRHSTGIEGAPTKATSVALHPLGRCSTSRKNRGDISSSTGYLLAHESVGSRAPTGRNAGPLNHNRTIFYLCRETRSDSPLHPASPTSNEPSDRTNDSHMEARPPFAFTLEPLLCASSITLSPPPLGGPNPRRHTRKSSSLLRRRPNSLPPSVAVPTLPCRLFVRPTGSLYPHDPRSGAVSGPDTGGEATSDAWDFAPPQLVLHIGSPPKRLLKHDTWRRQMISTPSMGSCVENSPWQCCRRRHDPNPLSSVIPDQM